MLDRNQTRKHLQSAAPDREVVIAASIVRTAKLDHAEPPARCTEHGCKLLQRNDRMRDALKVEIRTLRCLIIEQQDRAFPSDEKLLERQNLASIAQRALSEQTELRQGI